MANALVWWTYVLSSVVLVAFGLLALSLAWWRQRTKGPDDTEFFLTARNSFGTVVVAWSFFAGAMGSGALFGPPSFAVFGGIIGVVMYAVAVGFPIVIVAYCGDIVQRRHPNVVSLADFVYRRFGLWPQLYVAALSLFNMGIAMTAEYIACGDLFEYVIGTERIPIVVINGVVSSLYTAAGGLYVSLITDQAQAGLSIVLLFVLIIYVAATFRAPLPRPLPPGLGSDNYTGLASIATLPISLITATFYSEAVWQRCWASADPRSLKIGAFWGFIAATSATFLFGFGGFLALWGGVFPPDGNPNTILFTLLGDCVWIKVAVAVLAVTMSESVVDSLQNAVVDNVSTVFLPALSNLWSFPCGAARGSSSGPRPWPLWTIRLLVLLLNVPPIYFSLGGYSIISVFLLANLCTATSTIPIVMGFVRTKWAERTVSPFSVLFGCFLGLASIFVYCSLNQRAEETYQDSVHRTFITIPDYPPFLLALGFSTIGVPLGRAIEYGIDAMFGLCAPGFSISRWVGAKPYPEGLLHRPKELNGGILSSAQVPKEDLGKLEYA